jgi:hypothetical protein
LLQLLVPKFLFMLVLSLSQEKCSHLYHNQPYLRIPSHPTTWYWIKLDLKPGIKHRYQIIRGAANQNELNLIITWNLISHHLVFSTRPYQQYYWNVLSWLSSIHIVNTSNHPHPASKRIYQPAYLWPSLLIHWYLRASNSAWNKLVSNAAVIRFSIQRFLYLVIIMN